MRPATSRRSWRSRTRRRSPGSSASSTPPFSTQSTPRAGQPFNVRGIALGGGLTVEEIERRRDLLKDLDRTFAGFESSDLVNGLDAFSQRAYDIISSPRSREAFDISRESSSVVDLFGEDPFSQSCLLATRLVEAGVRFVSIANGGWDTHQDNFNRLKNRNLPELDAGLAGLFHGARARRACSNRPSSSSPASSAGPRRSTSAAAATTTRGPCSC